MEKNIKPSISEDNALAAIADSDQCIYSVGISSGGIAEMRMAKGSLTRRITATTIDCEGAKYVQNLIGEAGLSGQIDVKMEDVTTPLPYADSFFDFIYARLVLHYLPKNSLMMALDELRRILKPDGKIFVVVRSTECFEARNEHSIWDPQTGMTTYTSNGHSYSRYFHSAESIQQFLVASGFHIKSIKLYQEQLCIDFHRTQLSEKVDSLIEVLGHKK